MKNGFNSASFRRLSLGLGGGVLAVLLASGPLAAQSANPALEAARSSGQVGEQTDGYLGFPATPSDEVRRTADTVNIKRRKIYVERAQANGSTVEDYAFTTSCQLIARTKVGEKYQAPDGSWRTRTAEPPLRDNRCPPVAAAN
ncbi:MAG: YdbL family protein [Novosphingobium sp.]|uniref:YdbL family protein n=1 Tax=Novosphingobium sp. TaxID=1874826 RepID=UPI003C79D0A3